MASGHAPPWQRFLHRRVPFLFKTCPQGNYHWRWDQWCLCGLNEHFGDWHGGVYSFSANCEIPTHRNMRDWVEGHEWSAHREMMVKRSEEERARRPKPQAIQWVSH